VLRCDVPMAEGRWSDGPMVRWSDGPMADGPMADARRPD
jgi:hypothetical protein